MNYLDVYFSRVNHFGETTAERLKNSGIVAFEKWMAQSPFTVTDLSVERGLYFSGIIQTSKDKEEVKIMYLYVALDIPIQVGDILTWRQDNGATEKWLLLQKIHKVHPTYQTFQIIKCNFELKWIDFNGYLRKSWAYAVSSVDSKVKSNFRMWHSLISPQPNKFAEIIMPRPVFREKSEDYDELMRGVTFIIENEGWVVIECDWTSVEGIVYMSLTETKVNYQYDDRDIDVADTDRYKFPELPTMFEVGQTIVPLFEHDTLNQWEIELQSSDTSIVAGNNNQQEWFQELQAVGKGQCFITMRLKTRPAVTKKVEITINQQEEEFIAWIEGPDKLRLDRQDLYKLVSNSIITDSDVHMEIENDPSAKQPPSDYAKLIPELDNEGHEKNQYILHANAKNKLGKVVLVATYNNVRYTKTVEIIPLW